MNDSSDAPPAYLSFCPRDTFIFCLLVAKDISEAAAAAAAAGPHFPACFQLTC